MSTKACTRSISNHEVSKAPKVQRHLEAAASWSSSTSFTLTTRGTEMSGRTGDYFELFTDDFNEYVERESWRNVFATPMQGSTPMTPTHDTCATCKKEYELQDSHANNYQSFCSWECEEQAWQELFETEVRSHSMDKQESKATVEWRVGTIHIADLQTALNVEAGNGWRVYKIMPAYSSGVYFSIVWNRDL